MRVFFPGQRKKTKNAFVCNSFKGHPTFAARHLKSLSDIEASSQGQPTLALLSTVSAPYCKQQPLLNNDRPQQSSLDDLAIAIPTTASGSYNSSNRYGPSPGCVRLLHHTLG